MVHCPAGGAKYQEKSIYVKVFTEAGGRLVPGFWGRSPQSMCLWALFTCCHHAQYASSTCASASEGFQFGAALVSYSPWYLYVYVYFHIYVLRMRINQFGTPKLVAAPFTILALLAAAVRWIGSFWVNLNNFGHFSNPHFFLRYFNRAISKNLFCEICSANVSQMSKRVVQNHCSITK